MTASSTGALGMFTLQICHSIHHQVPSAASLFEETAQLPVVSPMVQCLGVAARAPVGVARRTVVAAD